MDGRKTYVPLPTFSGDTFIRSALPWLWVAAESPCPECGTVDALSWRREQNFLDHVPDMVVCTRIRSAPASVEVKGKIELAHIPATFICVTMGISGVPVGTQMGS